MKRTWKNCYLGLLTLFAMSAYGQNGVWQDGNPSFTQIYADTTNLSFEPISRTNVYLTETDKQFIDPESTRYVLDGITWQWPMNQNEPSTILLAAEDVETIEWGGDILYVVADGSGKKVVVLRLSDNQVIRTFEAPVGKELHLGKPSDVELLDENGLLKLLIVDESRHRVIKIDYITKNVEWQYGMNDQPGNGINQLNSPTDAVRVPNTLEFIICDRGNNRILWINPTDNSTVWEWGSTELNVPVDVEFIPGPSGRVLITDQGNNRVIIVDVASNNIVWEFSQATIVDSGPALSRPSDADLLGNGNILITDAGNGRIIEVKTGNPPEIVWNARKQLAGLTEADRIVSTVPELNDQTLFIAEDRVTGFVIPFRLSYQSTIIESKPWDAGQTVNFDSVFFTGIEDAGITDFKVQMRSAATELDLAVANWYGPFSDADFYEESPDSINAIHDGDRWLQFRFFLETNNKLYTPVVSDLRVKYHYYTDKIGILKTNLIGTGPQSRATGWRTLKVTSTWPSNPVYQSLLVFNVNLLSENNKKLAIFNVGGPGARQFDLSKITALQGIEKLSLEVEFQSYISAFSPILEDVKITWDAIPTDVTAEGSALPKQFSLLQNYPNPFNGLTTISYTLPYQEHVILKIYDLLGKEMRPLVNEPQTAGIHKLQWDAGDLPSGVYLYQIQAGPFLANKKLVLLK